MNGHWLFPEEMRQDLYTGFVYVVRDYISGYYYIGKKNFRVGRGKHKEKMADWRYYFSSSNLLCELKAMTPDPSFHCIVLEQYTQPASLRYAETWSLCHVNAPCTELCLNVRIEEISWKIKEPPTERHRERLARVVANGSFRKDYNEFFNPKE